MVFAREVGHTLVFVDEGVIIEAGEPRAALSNPQHTLTKGLPEKVL